MAKRTKRTVADVAQDMAHNVTAYIEETLIPKYKLEDCNVYDAMEAIIRKWHGDGAVVVNLDEGYETPSYRELESLAAERKLSVEDLAQELVYQAVHPPDTQVSCELSDDAYERVVRRAALECKTVSEFLADEITEILVGTPESDAAFEAVKAKCDADLLPSIVPEKPELMH